MVSDFGFAILDILYLLAHDSGEYTLKVINEGGEASTSTTFEVAPKEGILTQPLVRSKPPRPHAYMGHFQDEKKAQAVQQLEDYLHRRPEETEADKQERMPVFVEPLSAPVQCESGDSVHFSASKLTHIS